MSNYLEPIEDGDLDLKGKFKFGEPDGGRVDSIPVVEPASQSSQLEQAEKKSESFLEISSTERDGVVDKNSSKDKYPAEKKKDDRGDEIKKDARDTFETFKKMDTESRVKHLVNVAVEKGVVHAVGVARHLEDNYTLDMLHDRLLSDELRAALLAKRMIKED